MCLIWSTTASLCAKMSFDAVDFSECHSEEVMFLLTLSVLVVSYKSKILLKELGYYNFGLGLKVRVGTL